MRDFFHTVVVQALTSDGWTITNDPFTFSVGEVGMRIDLGAEKFIAAEKEDRKIAVEIKTFNGQSPVHDFHAALGQYELYTFAMEEFEPERVVYLAIPKLAYESLFQRTLIKKIVARRNIKICLYDPKDVNFILWIN